MATDLIPDEDDRAQDQQDRHKTLSEKIWSSFAPGDWADTNPSSSNVSTSELPSVETFDSEENPEYFASAPDSPAPPRIELLGTHNGKLVVCNHSQGMGLTQFVADEARLDPNSTDLVSTSDGTRYSNTGLMVDGRPVYRGESGFYMIQHHHSGTALMVPALHISEASTGRVAGQSVHIIGEHAGSKILFDSEKAAGHGFAEERCNLVPGENANELIDPDRPGVRYSDTGIDLQGSRLYRTSHGGFISIRTDGNGRSFMRSASFISEIPAERIQSPKPAGVPGERKPAPQADPPRQVEQPRPAHIPRTVEPPRQVGHHLPATNGNLLPALGKYAAEKPASLPKNMPPSPPHQAKGGPSAQPGEVAMEAERGRGAGCVGAVVGGLVLFEYLRQQFRGSTSPGSMPERPRVTPKDPSHR